MIVNKTKLYLVIFRIFNTLLGFKKKKKKYFVINVLQNIILTK